MLRYKNGSVKKHSEIDRNENEKAFMKKEKMNITKKTLPKKTLPKKEHLN